MVTETETQHLATNLLVECILGQKQLFKPRVAIININASPEFINTINKRFN